LVDLYDSTGGATEWANTDNWLTGPVTTWYGIGVTDGRVTSISMESNNLNGKIPSSIGNLSELGELVLWYNALTDTIPASIGNLSKLEVLWLNYNQLTGSIPSSIGDMTSLLYLTLDHNQLTGQLPSSLGNLSKVQIMVLSDNQLSGNIPSEFGNMAAMYTMVLENNQFSGNIPSSLGNLVNLHYLDLDNNMLNGNVPTELGDLENLYELDLNNNQLNGNIPSSLGDLINLQYLDLSSNNFTFDGMEFIVQKFPGASYAPQANIHMHQNNSSLSVYAGGTISNNTYKWFKLGKTGSMTIKGDSVFQPADRGSYYAEITSSICTNLTLYTDTVEYLGTLPVTIINLKAYRQGKQNKIEWTGVTEMNIDRYEIQRSSNALGFITIGSARARGNGTQKTQYSFNDAKPLLGNNYYRLKIFDDDGKITYSNTVLVNINNIEFNTLIYPVPSNDILHVETNGNIPFSMLDQSGRILFTIIINGKGAIDVSHLNAGMYFLKNNSTGDVQKVVVIR
jgi:hypothetical protein